MASFTDTTPVFNPYVQQVPVDAMLQVGMTRQNQYNEGIQRIQSQIDRVAGLEIARDVDKQYLQSKLNDLGSDLKKVAAGDFSQYQLVNSVGGMINKIGRDRKIIDAVKSTQVVKKGNLALEAARKEGKSSPENEWWWNNQVSSWLQDPNVGASFNGSFTEYHDVDAKLRQIAEKLKEIDNSIDIPYRRDKNGNILTDNQGNPLVDDAMLRIKTKGKSAERILSNFYTSLDEKDKQQLLITSNYHYRNLTKDGIKNELLSNYNQEKEILNQTLVDLSLELKTNSELSTSEKAAIEAKINDINNRLKSNKVEENLQRELKGLEDTADLTDYKYRIYTQKYLTNLAKDLSYQSYQQELMNNPYSQMAMEKARLQFQYDNANRQQANWEAEFNWKQAEFFAKQQKTTGAAKPAVPGRLPTDVDTPTLSSLKSEITSLIGDRKTGEIGQLDVLTSKYAPSITDSTLSTPQQKREYLDKLAIEYAKDPGSINTIKDPNIKEYLEQRRALEIQAAQKQNLYAAAIEASKPITQQLDRLYENKEGILSSDGQELYTARDLALVKSDMIKNFTKYSDNLFPTSRAGTMAKPKVDINRFLRAYAGTDAETIAIALARREEGLPLSPMEKRIVKRSDELGEESIRSANVIRDRLSKFQSDYLSARMPERQSMIFTLDVNNSRAEDRIDEPAVEALLGAKFVEAEQLGGVDADKMKDFDAATVAKFKADKEATYTIEKRYDGSADLVISSKGERQVVPMTRSEFMTFFPGYSRSNPIDNIKYAILSSPNKTTNISGRRDDPVNAYITGYQLPQLSNTNLAPLVRLDVEGSPNNDGSANDRYVIRMYVNDNGIWKSDILTQAGYVDDAKLQAIIQQIGTKTVHDLLNKNRK